MHFYTNVRHTARSCSMQSHSFLSCGSLEKCFCKSTGLNSDAGAIQRHNLLWTSEHKCFPGVVTKQRNPVSCRCSSGQITAGAQPHIWNPFGMGSLTHLGGESCIAPSINWSTRLPLSITFHPQFWTMKQWLALQRIWIRKQTLLFMCAVGRRESEISKILFEAWCSVSLLFFGFLLFFLRGRSVSLSLCRYMLRLYYVTGISQWWSFRSIPLA